MGKGCCVTLDSSWFPALALCPISTVTFSASTMPTQTAVLFPELRVLASLLETSPRGPFPPRKGPSRYIFLCPRVGISVKRRMSQSWGRGRFLFTFFYVSTYTLHLEQLLCFYSFIYAQFFGLSDALGTADSVSDFPSTVSL